MGAEFCASCCGNRYDKDVVKSNSSVPEQFKIETLHEEDLLETQASTQPNSDIKPVFDLAVESQKSPANFTEDGLFQGVNQGALKQENFTTPSTLLTTQAAPTNIFLSGKPC